MFVMLLVVIALHSCVMKAAMQLIGVNRDQVITSSKASTYTKILPMGRQRTAALEW